MEETVARARSSGWMQSSGYYVCITPLGHSLLSAANDNNSIDVVP